MDISVDQLRLALLSLIAFVLSVSVHEFGHAWMASWLGDPLPRAQGRVTLSPRAHIDWIGTIAVPLLASFYPGAPLIAWGRPVQTDPSRYRRMSPRFGHVVVSVVGPLMNLILAAAVSVLVIVVGRLVHLPDGLATWVVGLMVQLNLILLFFNLIPVPPLDGGAVLVELLPRAWTPFTDLLRRYGMLVLFVLVLTPGAMGFLLGPARRLATLWSGTVLGMLPQ